MERFQIIYSGDVKNQLKKIVGYLETEWGVRVAESFIAKFEVIIKRLGSNPKIGKTSNTDITIRSLLITKHNRLYFSVNEHTVMLLQIFDTRRHPSKNKFE